MLSARRAHLQARQVIDLAIAIQQIPAPTFQESKRAMDIALRFEALGLEDVSVDELYNVYGWLPSAKADAPVLLISAHTDTVFPPDFDLSVRAEGDRVYGAGLGDNSLGVAALLSLAECFTKQNIPHEAAICFCANSREEGLGDLGGMRGVIEQIGERLKGAIVIEGMALGRIYHAGIAVRRLKLNVTTQGGHSWLHFGHPSAIHSLIHLCDKLLALEVPTDPRTTYNIGLIEGGTSVNTIAADAACYIDIRSADTATLQELEARIQALVAAEEQLKVHFALDLVGDRPAGNIPQDHPLVQLAVNAHRAINMLPELESGSTDANALLARGVPSVCVGVSYGGNAHVAAEYIETAPIGDGLWQLLLLAAAASNALLMW